LKNKRYSMMTKIVTNTLVLIVLGFVLYSAIIQASVEKRVKELYVQQAINEVNQIASRVEVILNSGADMEELQSFVEQITEENNEIAYAVLIDQNVTAVAHSDIEKIGRDYRGDSYTEQGCLQGVIMNSRFFADVQNAWVYDIMIPVYENGTLYGSIDIGIFEKGVIEINKGIRRSTYAGLGLAIILATVSMYIVCHRLFKNFKPLVHKCEQMGNGDFSEPIDEKILKSKDEVGIIAEALNHMREELRRMIEHNNVLTQEILSVSKEIDETTKTTSHLSESICSRMDLASEGSQKQDTLLAETTQMMEQINQGMDDVAVNMQNISLSANETVTNAKQGFELMRSVADQMTVIHKYVMETSQNIEDLGDKSNHIETVVGFINEIASQTNLLALNASIEAARAGENGRGFAVVAGEVGKLAEESSKAAKTIIDLVQEIQAGTKVCKTSMNRSESSLSEGIHLVEKAGDSFYDILQQITNMSEEFSNISAVAQEVTASNSSLLTSVEEISEISAINLKQTAEATDVVGEQNEKLKLVAQSAERIGEVSIRLDESMKVFRI